jgi:hypothetical protein
MQLADSAFGDYCDMAREAYSDPYKGSDSDLIPVCLQILDLIYKFPDRRSQFVDEFIAVWKHPDYAPHELIAFCMRHLRWEELKRFFEQEMATVMGMEDHRAIPCIRTILEAYEDDWTYPEEEPYSLIENYTPHSVPRRQTF